MNKNQILRIIDLIIVVLLIITLLYLALWYTGQFTYVLILLISCGILGICRKIISKSQKFTNKEIDGKLLDNRCIGCGSTEDLVLYSHGKKTAYTCPKCNKNFERWNCNDILIMGMYLILLVFTFISLYIFIGSVNDPTPNLIMAIIPPLLAIIAYVVNFKHNSSENKPKKYFRGYKTPKPSISFSDLDGDGVVDIVEYDKPYTNGDLKPEK